MTHVVVNGRRVEVAAGRKGPLLAWLREELGLCGAKYGCGESECGVCTVLVDGEPVRACTTQLEQVEGKAVVTIESPHASLQVLALQQAFVEIGAMQCGYCTPGMILTAAALLAEDSSPDEARIKSHMQGNICRCGTYPRIMRAIGRAGEILRQGTLAPIAASVLPPPLVQVEAVPWDKLEPSQRDYFSALGDGLVVVAPPAPAPWGPPLGGAWIHVASTGAVTAFTGKVEVGQGTRTGCTLLVAEELGVSMQSVRLLMGDTDVVPWDLGTFGSMSTPTAAQQLRKASAKARDVLIGLAAKKWNVERNTLQAANGRIHQLDGGRDIGFGELVEGLRALEIVSGAVPLRPPSTWTAAGKDTPAVGRTEVVTGAKTFPTDFKLPGMLYAKVLRPPAFGATLRSVDTSQAEAMGAKVVHEGAFVAIAAPSVGMAHRALAAISAQWTPTTGPTEAELEGYLRAHPSEGEGWQGPVHDEKGDVAGGLAASQVQLEASYHTAYIAHVPIEPRVAIADWSGGRLCVWTGTQVPFMARNAVARSLAVAEENVRIIVPDTGCGFGGKEVTDVAIEAARVARAVGQPVKVLWSREEEFTWGHFRPAAFIDIRSGARRDGTIEAWEIRNCNAGSAALFSPYAIVNQSSHYQPAASPLSQGPYRALAATANNFAREAHMDELAAALGIDPVAFRLRNLVDPRLVDVLDAVTSHVGWSTRQYRAGVGMGVALGLEKGGRVATCAEVRALADGRWQVTRVVTAFECGALVNPDAVRNQIEGATIMGLGGALFEAIHFADGRILNPRLSAYRVPRFSDLPAVEVLLLDRKDLPSAGAGETPLIGVAPAIANALFDATGKRFRSLPFFPQPPLAQV